MQNCDGGGGEGGRTHGYAALFEPLSAIKGRSKAPHLLGLSTQNIHGVVILSGSGEVYKARGQQTHE